MLTLVICENTRFVISIIRCSYLYMRVETKQDAFVLLRQVTDKLKACRISSVATNFGWGKCLTDQKSAFEEVHPERMGLIDQHVGFLEYNHCFLISKL